MDIKLYVAAICFLGTLRIQISQQTPSKCIPLPQTGKCRAFMPRYFFNATSEACEQFIYGGCGGNDNNFESTEECEKECITDGVDPCFLEPDVGMCRASIPRYFYNRTSGMCQSFIYGGCGGNNNNFETTSQCSEKCVPKISQYLQIPEHESFYHCFLRPDTGSCQALIPKYFYNTTFRGCQQFMYGGCGGNQNKFDTMEACTDSCNGADHCLLKPDNGECMAMIPRYFYNATAKKCEMFFYGGCRGNDNNFESTEVCEKECAKDNDDASSLRSPVAVLLLSSILSFLLTAVF